MPFGLLRFLFSSSHPEPRMFRTPARLKPSYDVVIIGAGGHGLAAAYYLRVASVDPETGHARVQVRHSVFAVERRNAKAATCSAAGFPARWSSCSAIR